MGVAVVGQSGNEAGIVVESVRCWDVAADVVVVVVDVGNAAEEAERDAGFDVEYLRPLANERQ